MAHSRGSGRAIALDFTDDERAAFWKRIKTIRSVKACWYLRGLAVGKYGMHAHRGAVVPSHRLAYAMAYGVDPGAMRVLHGCDDSRCQNPRHLRLGTDADNANDRVVARMMRGIAGGFRDLRGVVGRPPGIRVRPLPPLYGDDGSRIDRRTIAGGKKGVEHNDVAQAIRWCYWNICQDQAALAAAFAVTELVIANAVLRNSKPYLPPVHGEPDPGGRLAERAARWASQPRRCFSGVTGGAEGARAAVAEAA